jgi:aminopeptidase N
MSNTQPKAIYLADYKKPNYFIEQTKLHFDLFEDKALVTSELSLVRNTENNDNSLQLNGDELELLSVAVNGVVFSSDQYQVTDEYLVLTDLPDKFTLKIETKIKPQENTALEGLYKSSKMFCTQCEAEGFRRITYYLDRPDVMSVFETTIIADQEKYPVLLSNGNLTSEEVLTDGRHKSVWQDPHKKPCYLFALVAGDLEHIEDSFKTMSGTDVTLRIYVESQNINKCDYAMDALKRSMKWDEETYGREYDLNIFNIVAVDDFNMGAMENKSLNIFNSSCVLANPETATDATFQRIESIVAHEYFHNWSGNRVTCRDWFQLSLKEGFTVFRDGEFSSDMGSRSVKRIEDATLLRTAQFAEDAGPMAHAIRPASFIEISNFYTLTIYEKGCEVVGMIHNLLGKQDFRKGSDLYFDRHDGQAVTTEDFVKAMEDASGKDLTQFRNWYSQAGTPAVVVSDNYNSATQQYALTFKQSCRVTAETIDKKPYHIPIEIGLLLSSGKDAKLTCISGNDFNPLTGVVGLKASEETFVFSDIKEKPVPSLLRGFSAPVKLSYPYSRDELLFLMANDSDGFNRWDAGQALATDIILQLTKDISEGQELVLDARLVAVYKGFLANHDLDNAVIAKMLTLPSLAFLLEQQDAADVHLLYTARQFVKNTLASQLHQDFYARYQQSLDNGPYEPKFDAMAKRSLKNLCLQYMLFSGEEEYVSLAKSQYDNADNMTDQSGALSALVESQFKEQASSYLDAFYNQWKHDSLVVNLWFSMQACSDQIEGIQDIDKLLKHDAYDIKNPNKVRSVVGAFAGQNLRHFHQKNGDGYNWLADQIIVLDGLNPQIASRLVGPLTKWKRISVGSGQLMQNALKKIANSDNLSKDVYEVVSKSLVN